MAVALMHPARVLLALLLASAALSGCVESARDLATGSACTAARSCTGGVCLYDWAGWPGGLCTSVCEGVCEDDARCVAVEGAAFCLPACESQQSCRDGYVCSPTASACLPDCRTGWSCGDFACDPATGLCAVPAAFGAPPGSPCTDALDCASMLCLPATGDSPWPGGTCAAPCKGAACADGTCVRLGGQALCVGACSEEVPCRDGYVCTAASACLPDCRDGWPCGDGFICENNGLCMIPPSDGAPVGAPCERDTDCGSGVCAKATGEAGATGWTGGSCIAPCGSASCGEHAVCAVLGGEAWCVDGCPAGACRPGYVCEPSLGACLPDCRTGFDCGDGFACGTDGLCTLAGGDLAPIGAPCSVPSDCASGLCAQESTDEGPTGWQGGACIAPCGASACGDDTSCAVLGSVAWCLDGCGPGACREGYVCTGPGGACLPDCRNGFDCGDLSCGDTGRCEPDGAELGGIGAPCSDAGDCATGICFTEHEPSGPTGWTGGTCAGVCGSAACGADSGCVVLDGVGWCLPRCNGGGCRDGYVCSDDLHVCLPDCRDGWSCGESFVCAPDGQCHPDVIDLGTLGEACVSHAECASGTCLVLPPDAPGTWSAGICTKPCTAGCGPGNACAPFGPSYLCVPACGTQADCPQSYACRLQAGASGACIPSCLDGWPCPPGAVCSSSGVCGVGGAGGP